MEAHRSGADFLGFEPRTLAYMDYPQNLPSYVSTPGNAHVVTPEDRGIQQEIFTRFQRSNRFNIYIGGAIGDTIVSSGVLHGMLTAIRKTHAPGVTVTVFVDERTCSLYRPLEEAEDVKIHVRAWERQEDMSPDDFREEDIPKASAENEDVFSVELSPTPDIPSDRDTFEDSLPRASSFVMPNGSTMTKLDNAFAPRVALLRWKDKLGNKWPAAYTNGLLGLPYEYEIAPHEARPFVPFSKTAEAEYTKLTDEKGINRAGLQIGLAMQSAIAMKLYSLSNWQEVLTQIYAGILDYPSQDVNFNIFCGPDDTSPEGYKSADIQRLMQEPFHDRPNVHINLIQEPLGRVAVLMGKQDVAVGIDTGVMQLATAIGIPSATLFLSSQFARNWYTQEDYSYTVAANGSTDRNFWAKWEQGDTTAPEYNGLMNTISPFFVAEKALRVLRDVGKLRYDQAPPPVSFGIKQVLQALRREISSRGGTWGRR